ncbi:MAG: UDP-N-acetylmuramate--L-alanine ligase [Phycisphaeraceae bacterium]|nr:UDP-N-acetylmuramate--L-alanine ligase [Phycisphaeraceae bacterium]
MTLATDTNSPMDAGSGADSDGAVNLSGAQVHFVGIGGCGMSGLARMARARGARCDGTDQAPGAPIDQLRQDGIEVRLEQSAGCVPDDCDMLVISAAIRDEHPEVVEARRRGVPVLKYAQLLGRLMLDQTGVAIAGTHGKSTTCSLLSHVLIQCGLDPSLIVGAQCPQIGGGWRVGARDLLVAEACEFDRSFLNLNPTHAVILNIEEDHLDIYRDLGEIVDAFASFARRLPGRGSLLVNHEMPHRLAVTAGLDCAVETIGFAPQADWRVELDETPGAPRARLHDASGTVCTWQCPIPGEHMAYNAAAAAVTAHRLGAAWTDVGAALETFAGLERRMQPLGHRDLPSGRLTVVDDYGHHPTEIDTTLRALRRHARPKRLICVFQPHQHSRTRFLMEHFAVSFSAADVVIVPHIYFVRDPKKEQHTVSSRDLVDRLRQRGITAMHLYPFEAIVEQLELIARDGDLLVTMGAGDVWKVAEGFLGAKREN